MTVVGRSAGDVGRALGERRPVTTTASCGMCGRTSIESVTRGLAPVTSSLRVDARTMALLPDRLRAVQAVFAATGGLHAAGLFDRAGETVLAAEDVGRHNAVDKVVGAMMMRDALPLSAHVLFVSGRTSFEIVQKAFVAGIPIVGAVSAPSSLAIELAVSAGVTLVGFVRAGGFNIYSHPERIV